MGIREASVSDVSPLSGMIFHPAPPQTTTGRVTLAAPESTTVQKSIVPVLRFSRKTLPSDWVVIS